MRIMVQTTAGQLVDTIDVDDDLSPFAAGRMLTGDNSIIGGRLGRAMRDARTLERGGDPERPSERAMRFATRDPYVGRGIDGCLRSAQIDREEADTLVQTSRSLRRLELAQSAAAWEARAVELVGENIRRYARENLERAHGDDEVALARTEAVLVANGYPLRPDRTTVTLARLLVQDARQRAAAEDDARRD